MHPERSTLFSSNALPDEVMTRTAEALRAVDRADVNDLLTRDVDVLLDEVLAPLEHLTLLWDQVTMTEPASSTMPMNDGFGHTVHRLVVVITFKVPCDGDPLLLTYWSHNGAPVGGLPGRATPAGLELTWSGELNADPAALRDWLDQRRRSIETFLVNNNRDVDRLNHHMRGQVAARIQQRRDAELARRDLTARLPFPVERRPEAPRPLAVHRKQVRIQRRTPGATFAPEPALEEREFDDIVGDCIAMATVFERTPGVEALGEEALRNLILGMLNTNYTGGVAGELFNGAGKTDICIRVDDRNILIGECKFYDGAKTVSDAVDQLLSYLVWRDTKAALLLFVRGGNFTQAVERAQEAVRTHPQCQKVMPTEDATRRSDYLFARADDQDRAIRLALLPFHVRAPSALDR